MHGVDPKFVTTAFELPGYPFAQNIGLVRGLVVRSRGVGGNLLAGLQSIFGGNITLYAN